MSDRKSSLPSAAIWLTPLAIGVGLLIAGMATPVYTDIELARQIKIEACSAPGGTGAPRVIEGWYDKLSAVKTLRHPLMQGGISLILATLAIKALRAMFASPTSGRLQTPSSAWQFFILGTGVILLSWFSQMHSLRLDLQRGEFPWCADTIIIPMYQLTIAYTVLLAICLVFGFVLSRFFSVLPVDLLIWRNDAPARTWIWTLVCGIAAILVGVLGIEAGLNSAFLGTPAAITAIYLLLSTRAALIATRDGMETEDAAFQGA